MSDVSSADSESFDGLFDEAFSLISYHCRGQLMSILADEEALDDWTESDRLDGIEVLVRFGDSLYVMDIETTGLHAHRLAEDEDEEPGDYEAYIVAADWLRPSHIATIRELNLEELEPVLTKQKTQGE